MTNKSKRGGARKGSGRKPGPGGTKIDKNIALTPAMWEFLMSGEGSAAEQIEKRLRRTAAFKAWAAAASRQNAIL